MSISNVSTIYTEFVTANNISVGNSTSNIAISSNSTALLMSANVYINALAIAVTDNASNTSFVNSSSLSTANLIVAGVGAATQNATSNYQSFSTPGWDQWVKPFNPGAYDFATLYIWAGGGGGYGNSTIQSGGGGGACVVVTKLLSELNAICNVYVAFGGLGGTTGFNSTAGQTSLF